MNQFRMRTIGKLLRSQHYKFLKMMSNGEVWQLSIGSE